MLRQPAEECAGERYEQRRLARSPLRSACRVCGEPLLGSAAGGLIGLEFVVVTLIADSPALRLAEAGAAFATPVRRELRNRHIGSGRVASSRHHLA